MAKPSRFKRGSMPDVPLHEREPDGALLACGELGPWIGGQLRQFDFKEIHPALQEMLVRMDVQEVANLRNGLAILVRFEPDDFSRLRLILKLINILFGIGRVVKWTVMSFLAGLAAVTLAGEQIQKIIGYLFSLLKLVKS